MKARIAEKIAAIREKQEARRPEVGKGTERHYTPEELAEIWRVHPDTVRREFADRDGVLKLGRVSTSAKHRRYTILRIPESVVNAVHAEKSR